MFPLWFVLTSDPRLFYPECSASSVADLVFLVDGSWSVGRENFKYIRSVMATVAGAFDLGEDKTRVGVVQYSGDVRSEFTLKQHLSRGEVLRALSSLPYKGGETMTGNSAPEGAGAVLQSACCT